MIEIKKTKKATEQITVRFEVKTMDKIRELSEKNDVSISEVVSQLVEGALKK
jgi:hypothetical protein